VELYQDHQFTLLPQLSAGCDQMQRLADGLNEEIAAHLLSHTGKWLARVL
jgi:hypothetical protein